MDQDIHVDQTGKRDEYYGNPRWGTLGVDNLKHHSSQRAHFEHYLIIYVNLSLSLSSPPSS